MAIPINSEDFEEYGSLEIILEQLLVKVRKILLIRRQQQILRNLAERQRTSTATHVERPSASVPTPVLDLPIIQHPRIPLPDILFDLGDYEIPRPRKVSQIQPMPPQVELSNIWGRTGVELRLIADAFTFERCQNNINLNDKPTRLKDLSLLSIITSAFNRSIWTTVALLLGWGLLSRTR